MIFEKNCYEAIKEILINYLMCLKIKPFEICECDSSLYTLFCPCHLRFRNENSNPEICNRKNIFSDSRHIPNLLSMINNQNSFH